MTQKENKEEQKLKEMLLQRTKGMLDATIDDVYTPEVLSCDYNDLAAKAVRTLLEQSVLSVLVIKDGVPFNIVTVFDLLRLAYEEVFDPKRDFMRLKVGDIISEREFIYVAPKTKLYEVVNLMLEKRVRLLPVIDKGNILGVCSTIDLMKWYQQTHEEVRTGKL